MNIIKFQCVVTKKVKEVEGRKWNIREMRTNDEECIYFLGFFKFFTQAN